MTFIQKKIFAEKLGFEEANISIPSDLELE